MYQPATRTSSRTRRWVLVHALVALQVFALLVVIWALTLPHRAFWPAWVAAVLGAVVLAHAGITAAVGGARRVRVGDARVAVDVAAVCAGAITAMLWAFWLLQGDWFERGVPWPVWPMVGLAFVVGIVTVPVQLRAADAVRDRRIEQLTRTRRDVLEAQELELRRIERDLHDGAQARLALLGMQLGQLEHKSTDDELKARIGEARATAAEAQQELRSLARGIYPPVLADRGLVAAVESLAATSGGRVAVTASVDGRPIPSAVEGACYFVVAESVANALKHSGAERIEVAIARGALDVAVTITDDGAGCAATDGSGITGMRRRIEALDGTFEVQSPDGGPTTVRVQVPCES